jgi:hypothetical protein
VLSDRNDEVVLGKAAVSTAICPSLDGLL